MNTRVTVFLSAAASLTVATGCAGDNPLPFTEAVFTEVINDVQIVRRTDASAVKAAKDTRFLAPDFVKTGRSHGRN
jgi:hypothetical protein